LNHDAAYSWRADAGAGEGDARAPGATDWIDGRASVGSQGAQVKRNRQLAEGSPLALELGQIVSAALMANPLFFSSALPLRILPPFFNSYAGGEHYGPHVDGAIRAQRGGPALRTDVSCTVFLASPKNTRAAS
jgi:PKHD-type hydroxylase